MKKKGTTWIHAGILLLVYFTLYSCKSTVVLYEGPGENIRIKDVVKNDLEKEKSLKNIWVKKIDGTISWEGEKENFKASLKLKRDSVIMVSLRNKIGIEALRIICTQDTFRFYDRINRNYYIGTYDALTRRTGYPMSYYFIQSALLNEIISIKKEKKYSAFKEKEAFRLEDNYLVARFHERINDPDAYTRNADFEYRLHRENMNISSVIIKDSEDRNEITLFYKDHVAVEQYQIPKTIIIKVNTEGIDMDCKLALERVLVNTKFSTNYTRSTKYNKIEW
jgi:hypothetical protein